MFESFFGLGKRPFAATPDPACFIPIDGAYRAFSSLVQCVVDGRGIGVLTAPAGLGKSLLCQRVVRELEGRFSVVFLPNANFQTRRSLLQAVLYELGYSFVRMEEQALRLELMSALRRVRPARRGVALIVDEAHLLAPRMLEELRTLTNFVDGPEPLLRIVVSGQLALEETLSQPALTAFNQRIGSQISLQSFTRQESSEYISRRLAWAGANVLDVFSRPALGAICEASDGSPRCLNQLCDHSLLSAFLASERPVSLRTVHQSLDDLKRLPLTWNDSLSSRHSSVPDEQDDECGPIAVLLDEDVEMVGVDDVDSTTVHISSATSDRSESQPAFPALDCVECGADDDNDCDELGASDALTSAPVSYEAPVSYDAAVSYDTVMYESLEFGEAVELGEPLITTTLATPSIDTSKTMVETDAARSAVVDEEEVVVDHYAALDAAVNRLARTMRCVRAVAARREPATAVSLSPTGHQIVDIDETEPVVFDVVLPEEVASDEHAAVRADQPHKRENKPKAAAGERRYEFLFSELRRRQRA